MIPAWKVRRELTRFGQQLRAIPESFWERRATKRYDARFPTQLRISDGGSAAHSHIALLLIYPRPDLAQSTSQLCASLQQAGFSPMVVSNAPLSETDRARLLPLVWRLIERPNVGHDFGGYRDGLRLLRHWGMAPDEILMLNDSVWLLDADAGPLVERLRAVDADIAGSILRDKGGAPFLESYCYLMPKRVFSHPRVVSYWDDLVLTSNKYKVIRRGERDHSAALLAAGFRLGAAFDDAAFLQALQSAPDDVIRATVTHAAWLYARDAEAAQAVLAKGPREQQRNVALELIRRSLARGQFYSLFPVAARALLGYPFLKRSGDRVAVLWRKAYLSAITAGDLASPDPVILSELRDKVGADTAKVDLA